VVPEEEATVVESMVEVVKARVGVDLAPAAAA
jgi:hypothetical protein